MEDFLDQILSSSSWSDVTANGRSSWIGNATSDQTNGILSDHLEEYEGDEKNSSFGLNKGLYNGEIQLQEDASHHLLVPSQHDNESHESKLSLHGVIGGSSSNGPMGLQLNASPAMTLPHNSNQLPESGSGFPLSIADSRSASLWPSSYGGVSTFQPVMDQGKVQSLGFQGDYLKSSPNMLDRTYLGDEKLPQMNNLPAATEHDELHNARFPPFSTGLQPHLQSSQFTNANSIKHYSSHSCASQLQSVPATTSGNGCNGAVKPRMRARRGQATDPHSIAERLRREKIAERMKNLQELVPNSNKTDKASMLDEIIEYVKFLQLQVKVLSMSRLGAAGAVVPLITDAQSEGSGSLLLSPSLGQRADLSESPDSIAFEQEVVKLMESNVTAAMQYLQTKGLCLMPIALAAAISGGKTTSNAVSSEAKSPTVTHGLLSPNSGPHTTAAHLPSSSNESVTKENVAGKGNAEDIATTVCNGAIIKQEEGHKPACNMRELKPKA